MERLRLRLLRVWPCLLAAVAAGAHAGAPGAAESSHLDLDVGAGYESLSSPLVRISPEQTLVYLPGLLRLRGPYASAAIDVGASWALAGRATVTLDADASVKRSPASPDLDFRSATLRPGLQLPLDSASLGIGLSLQALELAGRPFRQVRTVQTQWTRFDGDNHWAFVADAGRYRHKGDLADLDARTASVMVQRHLAQPFERADGLDMSVQLARERNSRGLDDLSHRSGMANVVLHWTTGPARWSAGHSRQWARFDTWTFPGEPARRDSAWGIDLGAELPLSPSVSLRTEFNGVRSISNLPLFGNRYQRLAATLRVSL